MRVAPSVSLQCYVCGSTFTVQNRVELKGRQRVLVQEPSACPFCDAPVKAIPPLDLGQAKGLLLAGKESPKDPDATERFLEQSTRTAQDAETLWAMARGVDFDAWEADLRDLLRDDPDKALTKELRLVARLRDEAREGTLFERLQPVVARVENARRALEAKHRAIVDERPAPLARKAGGSMAEQPNEAPGTWAGQFSKQRGEAAGARARVEDVTKSVVESPAAAATPLGSIANSMGSLLVLEGPDEARTLGAPVAKRCAPALEQAARRFERVDPPESALLTLSFVNALELCGAVEGVVEGAPVGGWLEAIAKQRRKHEDLFLFRCGFMAAALGHAELALRLGGVKPATPFKPGERFGGNVLGFLRYLATALQEQAPAADVLPAWRAFVGAFPLNKTDQLIQWVDLLWAARAYFARVEGKPVAQVGEALHAFVKPA